MTRSARNALLALAFALATIGCLPYADVPPSPTTTPVATHVRPPTSIEPAHAAAFHAALTAYDAHAIHAATSPQAPPSMSDLAQAVEGMQGVRDMTIALVDAEFLSVQLGDGGQSFAYYLVTLELPRLAPEQPGQDLPGDRRRVRIWEVLVLDPDGKVLEVH